MVPFFSACRKFDSTIFFLSISFAFSVIDYLVLPSFTEFFFFAQRSIASSVEPHFPRRLPSFYRVFIFIVNATGRLLVTEFYLVFFCFLILALWPPPPPFNSHADDEAERRFVVTFWFFFFFNFILILIFIFWLPWPDTRKEWPPVSSSTKKKPRCYRVFFLFFTEFFFISARTDRNKKNSK